MFAARGGFIYLSTSTSIGNTYLTTISSTTSITKPSIVGGNVWVSCTSNTANSDIITVKFDSTSNVLWQKSLTGATSTETPLAMAVDTNGNSFIVGYTNGNTVGLEDEYVAKYYANGTLHWQRTLGTASSEQAVSIAIPATANAVFMVGGTSNTAIWQTYIPNTGAVNSQRRANTANTFVSTVDMVPSYAVNLFYHLYLGSYNDGLGNIYSVATLAHVNSNFNSINWARDISIFSGNLYPKCVTHQSNNVYFGGYLDSSKGFVAKYNNNGNLIWNKQTTTAFYEINSIATDTGANANVYTVGQGANGIGIIQKLDSNGNVSWQQSVVNSNSNLVLTQVNWNSNYVYVTGYNYPDRSTIIMKTNDNGNIVGTFGDYTISNVSLSIANASLVNASATLTLTATTYTNAAGTMTDASSSYTTSTIPL